MIGHLKGQLADYKLPEQLHIVEELPFTATGKLRRHVLADRIAKGQRQPERDSPVHSADPARLQYRELPPAVVA